MVGCSRCLESQLVEYPFNPYIGTYELISCKPMSRLVGYSRASKLSSPMINLSIDCWAAACVVRMYLIGSMRVVWGMV